MLFLALDIQLKLASCQKMKKFFQKVKLDAKFKTAGEGHKLTDEPNQSNFQQTSAGSSSQPVRHHPMSDSQANAAIAAIERQEKSKPSTKKVIKLPEDQYYQQRMQVATNDKPSSSGIVEESKPTEYSVEGVKFVSVYTGDVYYEQDLLAHYKEELVMKLGGEDKCQASSLMIFTLNKNHMVIDAAVTTLIKYIDNIIAHESDEKYRKIRKGNKVFTEKVASVDGAEEFLLAIGFKQTLLPNADGEDELYFVLPNEVGTDVLNEAKNTLSSCKPLESKLHRDPRVYCGSDHITRFNLPNSFFNLTLNEVKREQGLLSSEVEQNQQLRTKAMREKPKTTRKYKYTLLRIKFPDGYILQGTFGINEMFEAVRKFVGENLSIDWVPFQLKTSLGKIIDQEKETLLALSLVPSAVLNVAWLPEVQAQLHEQGMVVTLKQELLHKLEELN